MIKRFLLLSLCILSAPFCSTFKPNIEHNSIKTFDNLFKNIKKTSKCRVSPYRTGCTSNKVSFDTSKKLQKYKPFYKIIYQLQLATTIRFKLLLIIFIFLRTIYSLYNNINDVVYIINMIDEKDIKEVKKVLELLSFINFINIFNIVTFLELYDIPEHLELINKKSILYRKYLKLYKKDCFMIKYI
jgi:hypothetical protein